MPAAVTLAPNQSLSVIGHGGRVAARVDDRVVRGVRALVRRDAGRERARPRRPLRIDGRADPGRVAPCRGAARPGCSRTPDRRGGCDRRRRGAWPRSARARPRPRESPSPRADSLRARSGSRTRWCRPSSAAAPRRRAARGSRTRPARARACGSRPRSAGVIRPCPARLDATIALRDRAGVEAGRARLADLAQRRAEVLLHQSVADRVGLAAASGRWPRSPDRREGPRSPSRAARHRPGRARSLPRRGGSPARSGRRASSCRSAPAPSRVPTRVAGTATARWPARVERGTTLPARVEEHVCAWRRAGPSRGSRGRSCGRRRA